MQCTIRRKRRVCCSVFTNLLCFTNDNLQKHLRKLSNYRVNLFYKYTPIKHYCVMALSQNDVSLLRSSWSDLSNLGLKTVGLSVLLRLYNDAKDTRTAFKRFSLSQDGDLTMEVLSSNPEIEDHAVKVASSIGKIIELLEKSDDLKSYLEDLGNGHKLQNVDFKHFDTMGSVLLAVIKKVLGEKATDDVMQSWEDAYRIIKSVISSVYVKQ
ncbi:uncharacterized protein LOC143452028 [Clavelina lepadiformis]|uniref:uncharacterized protein LOC143452028 n=1 Tax=Clavelina lepadiformis TaxID=159417 RepID=UPI004042D8F4